MDKVKQRKKSLKWDFIKYLLICVIFIFGGSWLISDLISNLLLQSTDGYTIFVGVEDTVYVQENATDINEIAPENYFVAFYGTDLLRFIVIPLWSLSCVAICGMIFYRRKLEKPIGILLAASENISNNRLDFSVEVPEQNELGRLCSAFETMRQTLLENNRELWRQAEERKRLNAAFSHDLRNPVTVLKGSAKMARQCAESGKEKTEQLIENITRIETYTGRIERYVEAMSSAGRLEQIQLEKAFTNPQSLARELENAIRLVVADGGKQLSFTSTEIAGEILLDKNVLFQITENLVSNAIRFAKQTISVNLSFSGDMLLLEVMDDGSGFPAGLLKNGIQPFQKGNEDAEHFGMGLYICELLCRKHGGYVEIKNCEEGASVSAILQIS